MYTDLLKARSARLKQEQMWKFPRFLSCWWASQGSRRLSRYCTCVRQMLAQKWRKFFIFRLFTKIFSTFSFKTKNFYKILDQNVQRFARSKKVRSWSKNKCVSIQNFWADGGRRRAAGGCPGTALVRSKCRHKNGGNFLLLDFLQKFSRHSLLKLRIFLKFLSKCTEICQKVQSWSKNKCGSFQNFWVGGGHRRAAGGCRGTTLVCSNYWR